MVGSGPHVGICKKMFRLVLRLFSRLAFNTVITLLNVITAAVITALYNVEGCRYNSVQGQNSNTNIKKISQASYVIIAVITAYVITYRRYNACDNVTNFNCGHVQADQVQPRRDGWATYFKFYAWKHTEYRRLNSEDIP